MAAMATKMLMGSRTTLRPMATARAMRQSALLPSTSALWAATPSLYSPPAWGFVSSSRSSYASTTTWHADGPGRLCGCTSAHAKGAPAGIGVPQTRFFGRCNRQHHVAFQPGVTGSTSRSTVGPLDTAAVKACVVLGWAIDPRIWNAACR